MLPLSSYNFLIGTCSFVFLNPSASRVQMPGIETTGMHAEHLAQPPHPELILLLNNEGVPYLDVSAKNTATFFKISHSCMTHLTHPSGATFHRSAHLLPCSFLQARGSASFRCTENEYLLPGAPLLRLLDDRALPAAAISAEVFQRGIRGASKNLCLPAAGSVKP
jgi:hypothetical protein